MHDSDALYSYCIPPLYQTYFVSVQSIFGCCLLNSTEQLINNVFDMFNAFHYYYSVVGHLTQEC